MRDRVGSLLREPAKQVRRLGHLSGKSETVGTAWIDPVHDKAGNMTTLPKPSSLGTGLTCTWDAWNRLVEVKEGATVVARYEYDGLARRVKKHLDSQSPASPNGLDAYVHFYYNSVWQELETRRSTSENTQPETLQPQYQYVWSQRYIDAPILRDENTDTDGLCDDGRIYYLGDANFNVTTLVDTGGDAVERYVYTPYGVLTIYDATWSNTRGASSYGNAYTYTGRQLDVETGLYYYRHRLYHAPLGRFINQDPLGYAAGDTNFFRYTATLPTSFVDPFGLALETVWDIASVIYDVGKITVGLVTDNPALVTEGSIDLACDGIALLIPGAPAGSTKAARYLMRGSRRVAREVVEDGTQVTIKATASRARRRVASRAAERGRELVRQVVDLDELDVISSNVIVRVRCGTKWVQAELDIITRSRSVYELKNVADFDLGDARRLVEQVRRQRTVMAEFGGKHAGVIFGQSSNVSSAAGQLLLREHIPIYKVVDSKLTAVITTSQ